jgi:hypothetical protein
MAGYKTKSVKKVGKINKDNKPVSMSKKAKSSSKKY